jgi:hypothetical protein
MKWTIKSTRKQDDTYYTTVHYKFNINQVPQEVTVEIPHFQPKIKSDLVTAIENRGISEKAKMKAAQDVDTIDTSVIANDIDVENNYNEPE